MLRSAVVSQTRREQSSAMHRSRLARRPRMFARARPPIRRGASVFLISGWAVCGNVHQTGFGDATRGLTLSIGAAFDLPVTLSVGATNTLVTVNADALLLETDRSQIAGTISQTEVEDLPYLGRNFLDLALLVPGVSPTNTAANQLSAETSAVGGQGISVNSQRNSRTALCRWPLRE